MNPNNTASVERSKSQKALGYRLSPGEKNYFLNLGKNQEPKRRNGK